MKKNFTFNKKIRDEFLEKIEETSQTYINIKKIVEDAYKTPEKKNEIETIILAVWLNTCGINPLTFNKLQITSPIQTLAVFLQKDIETYNNLEALYSQKILEWQKTKNKIQNPQFKPQPKTLYAVQTNSSIRFAEQIEPGPNVIILKNEILFPPNPVLDYLKIPQQHPLHRITMGYKVIPQNQEPIKNIKKIQQPLELNARLHENNPYVLMAKKMVSNTYQNQPEI